MEASKFRDWIFLYSPIWLVLVMFPLSLLDGSGKLIVAGILLLLAEPHFAATFPLIVDKKVKEFDLNFVVDGEEFSLGWKLIFLHLFHLIIVPVFPFSSG